MAKFPDTMAFTGVNTPVRIEGDVFDLEVEGEIPSDIDGAFFRVSPDPQLPPLLQDDIMFNGDGMITQFRFKNGKVNFKQRWCQTDKWKMEREAGHALFGAYRNPLTDDPKAKGHYRGTANTNAFFYGGKLYGLKEDSPAVAMDPNTLETFGYTDWDGQVTSPTFTAHPKIDPETGNLCAFGYAAKGLLTKDMVYYELTPEGRKTKEVWFEIPYYCMMHDFGVTKDYAIFHVVPIVSSWERLEAGLPHFGFDTTKEIHLVILPRDGEAKDVKIFTAPNCFASHVMNAFNDGTRIHFDTPEARNNMFPFFPDVHGAPFDGPASASRLTRWTVDMNSNSNEFEKRETLAQFVGEFPRIDDRYAMNPYRHGWMLGFAQGPNGRASLAHIDHATGTEDVFHAEGASTLQEPAFFPKSGKSDEGDGYIVQVALRNEEKRADLLLFDALKVGEGPIATIRVPMRLRFGLHGNWVDGVHLDRAAAGQSSLGGVPTVAPN